ncbi:synaptotagmin-14-like isoform X5 [Antedon mediterranea]|uniref:synaptotagmin-14-like isoform X5 n=1 Tax=Antedon mediterranea TaxID=105859 RepID=UPI003AF7A21C
MGCLSCCANFSFGQPGFGIFTFWKSNETKANGSVNVNTAEEVNNILDEQQDEYISASSKTGLQNNPSFLQNHAGLAGFAFNYSDDSSICSSTWTSSERSGYVYRVHTEDLGDVEQGTVGSGSFGSSAGLFDQDDENDTIGLEGGEVKPREPPPTVGKLEVAFSYSGEARRMNITVVKVSDVPSKDRGGPGSCRVRLALMPSKRQRAKTRIREGENPEFKELFRFTRLFPHELASTSMRFRLFGTEKMRKEQLIGECVTKFSSLNTNTTTTQTITIPILARSDTSGSSSPYSSSSDLSHSESNSSLQSLQHGGMPELLVGLSYNSTTGRLSVEILKGSHFKNLAAGRAPDSYVRVSLMSSSGFEMTKSKTSIRRGQPNPTFKETFIFQVAQFQLPDVTLLYTVFNKRAMKRKETLGWFSMGLQNSSEEELAHWNEMRDSKGHQVCRWHALLEP